MITKPLVYIGNRIYVDSVDHFNICNVHKRNGRNETGPNNKRNKCLIQIKIQVKKQKQNNKHTTHAERENKNNKQDYNHSLNT